MKKLEVRLTRQPGEVRTVGQLAEAGPRPASPQVYFEYDPAFLRDPHLLQLAGPAGIPSREAQAVLDEVASAVARWPAHAHQAGVGR
jgi:hypothetical protein